ncbi:hypothetical protein LguiA_033138 [Lonicera macranthoides]
MSNDGNEDPYLMLETSIREQLDELQPILPDCCIYRVPPKLRSVNEKAYTPQIASIGPLHLGKLELQAMEDQKMRYLKAFLDRTNMSLKNCIKVMKEWEERARNCYAERIKLTSDEFVKVILVDSCFIIEAILRYTASDMKEQTDFLTKPHMIYHVRTDLILLENQLPFFVLNGLFSIAFNDQSRTTFPELCINYFRGLMITRDFEKTVNNLMIQLKSGYEVKHLLDLLRISHISSSLMLRPEGRGKLIKIRNAAALQEAGMTFKRGSINCLLDLRFIVGVLEIPQITIDDFSEFVLRNLVAFEFCHYPFDSYITDYIIFMDSLIDTDKDVDILVENDVIMNWLGDSSAVAALVNSLAIETIVWGMTGANFNIIYESLNAYCNVRWHKWKATLKCDYFSTPWRIVSTIAAVVLLLLTFVQTITSIISL